MGKPKIQGMDQHQIHRLLKQKGYTWSVAAEAIGCTPNHLMNVSARRSDSRRVAVALCALIGKPVREVFQDRPQYQEDPKAERASLLDSAKKQLEKAGLAA